MSFQALCTACSRWLALALVGLLLAACQSERSAMLSALQGRSMGTTYSVKLVVPPSQTLSDLQAGIQATLDRIESRMSTYRDDSELSRFNQLEPGRWFEVSAETAGVVRLGLDISESTEGAFDMTVGPLVNLWGFGPGADISKAPDDDEIARLLQRVGYQHIQVREAPFALYKSQASYLDLSAIAKGYAVDQVAAYLAQQGVTTYLVEVGGELKTLGVKPDGSPWRIAVESPVVGAREIQRVIEVGGWAIATSGDYRNYFEQDGVRYSHTIDPLSGQPIRHRLASVTVLDRDCARADALATALMVMGDERGLAWARQQQLPAFFIIKGEEGFVEEATPEFAAFLAQ